MDAPGGGCTLKGCSRQEGATGGGRGRSWPRSIHHLSGTASPGAVVLGGGPVVDDRTFGLCYSPGLSWGRFNDENLCNSCVFRSFVKTWISLPLRLQSAPATPATPPISQTRISEYRLSREEGRGGGGAVKRLHSAVCKVFGVFGCRLNRCRQHWWSQGCHLQRTRHVG